MTRTLVGGLACAAVLAAVAPARANPEPLPFSYVAATLPKDALEVEMYTDVVATHAIDTAAGKEVSYAASQFQIELEYGLGKRFELGLYLTLAPSLFEFQDTPEMPEGNGAKERITFPRDQSASRRWTSRFTSSSSRTSARSSSKAR